MDKKQSLSILEELKNHIINLSQEEKDKEKKRIELFCKESEEGSTTYKHSKFNLSFENILVKENPYLFNNNKYNTNIHRDYSYEDNFEVAS